MSTIIDTWSSLGTPNILYALSVRWNKGAPTLGGCLTEGWRSNLGAQRQPKTFSTPRRVLNCLFYNSPHCATRSQPSSPGGVHFGHAVVSRIRRALNYVSTGSAALCMVRGLGECVCRANRTVHTYTCFFSHLSTAKRVLWFMPVGKKLSAEQKNGPPRVPLFPMLFNKEIPLGSRPYSSRFSS